MSGKNPLPIEIGLTAAIVAVSNVSGDTPEPMILVARETAPKSSTALPSGPSTAASGNGGSAGAYASEWK